MIGGLSFSFGKQLLIQFGETLVLTSFLRRKRMISLSSGEEEEE
jgi:hypothetical protein